MNKHQDTFMRLEELGSCYPAYQPTFDFQGKFIDSYHRFLATRGVKDGMAHIKNRRWFGATIPGWLWREDALKLYEMAFFSTGDILELGPYYGLSTCILAQANHNSPHPKQLYTVDLSLDCIEQTSINLRTMGLSKNVTTICDDALAAVRRFAREGKQFGFAFVDHSHAYEHVHPVCREIRQVLVKDGFCLFHDFNDARNRDSKDLDYGVYQAVIEGMAAEEFEFYGIYGCTALYRAL